MVDEKRIREMISDFASIYNFNLDHLPSEAKDYSKWPELFTDEGRVIADFIYSYVNKRNSPSTRILRITSSLEQEILEEILSSSSLQKA